jgi:TolB-like protein/Tfp pilus assembly protein PilF
VHHLPGGDRPRVFSLKSEVDAWLRAGSPEPHERPLSVAVLPFLNLSGDADGQYFGDGLADDIINMLVRIPGLQVTARTSAFAFGDRGRDIRAVGARLGVKWVIEGSVRRDRKRVRVSAQLINATDGFHAWSDLFDRQLADIFAIQDEIAQAIALALRLKIFGRGQPRRPTADLEAYDLWVKGRSFSQQHTPAAIARARDCYEAAIAKDAAFAWPYFGLADLLFYGVQYGLTPSPDELPKLRDALRRALELDDSLAEAHALLGVTLGIFDYDWDAADASFLRALELSPGSATALSQHAWHNLVPRLQFAQAIAEARQAVALDPLSPRTHSSLGLVLVAARQYELAVEETRAAVELGPGLWWTHWFYGTALVPSGRRIQGFKEMRRLYDEIHQPLAVGAMALICGLSSRLRAAGRLLNELEETAKTTYVPPIAFALAYIGLRDERMFEWLDRAIDARDPVVALLPSMPLFDGIRSDPRFRALLARMNLT